MNSLRQSPMNCSVTSRQAFNQNKFIFTKNLMKMFKIDQEVKKQEIIIEREETFKKMTNYFLKNYNVDKNFNSNMHYYQKKLGVLEPITIEKKSFLSTKKNNEQILLLKKLREAPSAIEKKKNMRNSFTNSDTFYKLGHVAGYKVTK